MDAGQQACRRGVYFFLTYYYQSVFLSGLTYYAVSFFFSIHVETSIMSLSFYTVQYPPTRRVPEESVFFNVFFLLNEYLLMHRCIQTIRNYCRHTCSVTFWAEFELCKREKKRSIVPKQVWSTESEASLAPDSMLDGFHFALPFVGDTFRLPHPAVPPKAHDFAITCNSHQYSLIKAVVQSRLFKTKRNQRVKACKIR